MSTADLPIQYYQVEGGRWTKQEAKVISEMPVTLSVNGENWLTFLCTPVDLEAMAVGFLFNEGLIQSMDEVVSAHVCASGDIVDVWLNHSVEKPERWLRTSGCTGGVTSVEIEDIARPGGEGAEEEGTGEKSAETMGIRGKGAGPAPLQAGERTIGAETALLHDEQERLMPEQVGRMIESLLASQNLYRKAGGAHTSALSDGQQIYAVSEDIGRHNTLDKIAGHYLMEKLEVSPRILLTTGRVSSEMMQKAARLGAAVVISRTSPSSLSIQMAQRWGITLIGYARGYARGATTGAGGTRGTGGIQNKGNGRNTGGRRSRFRIYTHPERIIADEVQE
jgi:FdhD protein